MFQALLLNSEGIPIEQEKLDHEWVLDYLKMGFIADLDGEISKPYNIVLNYK